MRAIDSDHVIARLDEIQPFAGNKAANASINLAKDVVRNAPTLSPDDLRGVGEWIPIMTELEYECSRCKKKLDDYINASEWAGLSEIPNYCPNCGAKMSRAEAEKAMEVSG